MTKCVIDGNIYFNADCITGSRKFIRPESVDLIITDPPYGIEGNTLHKHYNRNEDYVIDGYVEVPAEEYSDFSHRWIKEAERILKPNGQIYIVSGYTRLYEILDALRSTELEEINHLIWKFNFGVYTKRKYVSSHYHILYYEKPGNNKRTFNTFSRYGPQERDERGGSLNYQDREDVWYINREYKPGKVKNKNELPTKLLIKMILYSSDEGDMISDLFMGGFSTAKVAVGLNRKFVGFEVSSNIFERGIEEMENIEPGYLLKDLRRPKENVLYKQGESWTEDETVSLISRYNELMNKNINNKEAIEILIREFGRGRFSIQKRLKENDLNLDKNKPKNANITMY